MFRTARAITGLAVLGGVSIAGIVAWATGFLKRAITWALGLWDSLQTWLHQPWGIDHLLAGAGAVLVPLVILGLIVLIISGE